jgi:precorrin-6Y C5,15-methyltransferase (decarboxylating)
VVPSPYQGEGQDGGLQYRALGLPDDAFEQRRPLRGQITKREVRAVSLYSLGLRRDSVVWDIGSGTGSVALEAAFIAHRGRVYAIERDPESLPLLERNVARLSQGNVQVVPGEAPQALAELPDPDSVFVGGSGGRLGELLETVARRLKPQGRVVVNLAALERAQESYHRLRDLGLAAELVMVNAARGKEMGDGTVRLEALNPVFVVTGWRQ